MAAIGTVGGAIGTIFGLVGSCGKVVQTHDEAIRVKVIAEQDRVQRDKKIDATLAFHGQQIWTLDKKADVMNKKLDDISREVKK